MAPLIAEDPFGSFLRQPRRIRMLPFGGNGGDRLLQYATKRLVAESVLERPWEDEPFEYLGYPGGGLFGFYDDLAMLEALEPGLQPLVFFPRACLWKDDEAFERHVAEFERIGRPLLVYARDPVSAEQWRRLNGRVPIDVFLSHDCAVLYREVFETERAVLEEAMGLVSEGLIGIYRRSDRESPGWRTFTIAGAKTLELDPALVGQVGAECAGSAIAGAAYLAYWTLCRLPRLVITDHLHVAIARWLCERRTILLPTAQHKVSEAWFHSMASEPRNVTFAPNWEALLAQVEAEGLTLELEHE